MSASICSSRAAMMNHDELLYQKAQKVAWLDYEGLRRLSDSCVTKEYQHKIEAIATSMYHREEASAGLL